jgi:hypothetical protein
VAQHQHSHVRGVAADLPARWDAAGAVCGLGPDLGDGLTSPDRDDGVVSLSDGGGRRRAADRSGRRRHSASSGGGRTAGSTGALRGPASHEGVGGHQAAVVCDHTREGEPVELSQQVGRRLADRALRALNVAAVGVVAHAVHGELLLARADLGDLERRGGRGEKPEAEGSTG